MNNRYILTVCIAASILSHVGSLIFLQRHTLWYFSPAMPATETIELVDEEKVHRNQILKEAFAVVETETRVQEPLKECNQLTINNLQINKPTYIDPPPLTHNLSFPDPLLITSVESLSFSLPQIERFDLAEYLPKEFAALPELTSSLTSVSPLFQSTTALIAAAEPLARPEEIPVAKVAYPHPLIPVPLKELSTQPKLETLAAFPDLPALPTLEELETASYSDYFDTEIVFSPLESEEGFVFALTLIPHADLRLPKIRQHYSFLIDRSNSVQKERLAVVKSAVLRAVEELDFEDSFNIIAFDSKVDKFVPAPIPATASAIKRAKDFLETVQLGSFFSPANLNKPLALTMPSSEEDLHTAILLTDGESLSKKQAQRDFAMGWTGYNRGRVGLFWVGLGNDPHIDVLTATAALNRGKTLHAPSKRGIKRKLLKLMKTISHPIAKDLSVRGVSFSPAAGITLYPHSKQAPHLYLNEPYVILGKVKTLEPFILFVQGRTKDRWLNIKKTISFMNGKKGTPALQEQWALQRSYALYERYLEDLNPEHLAEADQLLTPYGLQVTF